MESLKWENAIKKLADIIEENKDEIEIHIDNDSWCIYGRNNNKEKIGYYKKIADSDNSLEDSYLFDVSSKWYGHGGNYGFLVADALVVLLNRRGFNIKAESV